MGICTMWSLTSGIFQKWVKQVNRNDNHDYTGDVLSCVLSNPLVDVALVGLKMQKWLKPMCACARIRARKSISRNCMKSMSETIEEPQISRRGI